VEGVKALIHTYKQVQDSFAEQIANSMAKAQGKEACTDSN